jgi:transcriptional regulator NrdR family protein
MKCPKCGGRTRAYDTRWWDISDLCGVTVRRRECVKCGCRYITEEKLVKITKEGRTR